MFGSQPHAAVPIIRDLHNNAKGFTSRILCFFPKPIFCVIQERRLQESEKETAQSFRNLLGMLEIIRLFHIEWGTGFEFGPQSMHGLFGRTGI